jgi:RNA polymerase sigma-70 factor (ECF subfamily)
LVERVVGGDQAAFGELIRPHSGRLLTLAARMLGSAAQAEEAVQDALASVWIARARLDPSRPIAPFLTTTVLNKCRDRLRRRKAAGFIGFRPSLDDLNLPDDRPNPEALAVSRDTLARLRKEIERLPLRLREALVLVAIDGRSQIEAADLLGVTEKAIETRVYRARKKLREKFDDF